MRLTNTFIVHTNTPHTHTNTHVYMPHRELDTNSVIIVPSVVPSASCVPHSVALGRQGGYTTHTKKTYKHKDKQNLSTNQTVWECCTSSNLSCKQLHSRWDICATFSHSTNIQSKTVVTYKQLKTGQMTAIKL